MSQAWRFAGFLVATAALGLVVVVLGPRLIRAAGPEEEIVTALKRAERAGVERRLPSGTLRSTALQYQRLSVSLDGTGASASVTGTLDFVGSFERPGGESPTRVSSLGLERMRWREARGGWVSEEGEFPRLAAIVEALEARRAGIEAARDAGVLRRVYRADGWYIRSEREQILVAEDYRLQEDRADRPVDERGTVRLMLGPADGGFAVER